MIARIQKSLKEKDQGFTLIELLVVMIIIGILAAIAIPVFLNQRKKAVDSSMKSDLRTVANAMETAYTDTQQYPESITATTGTVNIGDDSIKLSPNNTVTVTTNPTGAGKFCVAVTNAKSSRGNATDAWVYKSDLGGVQPAEVKNCS